MKVKQQTDVHHKHYRASAATELLVIAYNRKTVSREAQKDCSEVNKHNNSTNKKLKHHSKMQNHF